VVLIFLARDLARRHFLTVEPEMSDFSGNPFADTDDVNPFAVCR